MLQNGMALNYLVYGVAADGKRTQVASTPSARYAQRVRDAGNSPWAETIVFGSDGQMSRAELDRAAELEAKRDA